MNVGELEDESTSCGCAERAGLSGIGGCAARSKPAFVSPTSVVMFKNETRLQMGCW